MQRGSNLAYDFDYLGDFKPDKKKTSEKVVKTQAKPKQKIKPSVLLGCIAAIFALSLFLVAGEAKLYENNSTINSLKNQLENATTEANQAMIAYEKTIDLAQIENVAISEYSMKKPSSNEVIYLSADHKDYVEKVAKTSVADDISTTISGAFGIFGID